MTDAVVRNVTKDRDEGTGNIAEVQVSVPGKRKVEGGSSAKRETIIIETNFNILADTPTDHVTVDGVVAYRRQDLTLEAQLIQMDNLGNVDGYQKPNPHGASFV